MTFVPKWFVVESDGSCLADGPEQPLGTCYSMAIAEDDGCLVLLREAPNKQWERVAHIPLAAAVRLGEIAREKLKEQGR